MPRLPAFIAALTLAGCAASEPLTDEAASPIATPLALAVLYVPVDRPMCDEPGRLRAMLKSWGWHAEDPIEMFGPVHAEIAPKVVGFVQEWRSDDQQSALVRGDEDLACIIGLSGVPAGGIGQPA